MHSNSSPKYTHSSFYKPVNKGTYIKNVQKITKIKIRDIFLFIYTKGSREY